MEKKTNEKPLSTKEMVERLSEMSVEDVEKALNVDVYLRIPGNNREVQDVLLLALYKHHQAALQERQGLSGHSQQVIKELNEKDYNIKFYYKDEGRKIFSGRTLRADKA